MIVNIIYEQLRKAYSLAGENHYGYDIRELSLGLDGFSWKWAHYDSTPVGGYSDSYYGLSNREHISWKEYDSLDENSKERGLSEIIMKKKEVGLRQAKGY